MAPPLPMVGTGEAVEVAAARLADSGAVLVIDGGHPTGIVTRSDLLEFLSGSSEMSNIKRDQPEQAGFETRAIHAGQPPDPTTGAVVRLSRSQPLLRRIPWANIAATNTHAARTRLASALEQCLASLEQAEHGLAFASGLAAEDALLRLLRPGDHVVIPNDAYGGTFRLFDKVWAPFGLSYTAVDLTSLDRLESAWRDETKMVWIETPSNPLLSIVDIEAVGAFAQRSRRARRGGQHICHALPPAAAAEGGGRRGALIDEILGRPQRCRWRIGGNQRRRTGGKDRVLPERSRRCSRADGLLPRAARDQDAWPCVWSATARTRPP